MSSASSANRVGLSRTTAAVEGASGTEAKARFTSLALRASAETLGTGAIEAAGASGATNATELAAGAADVADVDGPTAGAAALHEGIEARVSRWCAITLPPA